jgi:hypothetical protein
LAILLIESNDWASLLSPNPGKAGDITLENFEKKSFWLHHISDEPKYP